MNLSTYEQEKENYAQAKATLVVEELSIQEDSSIFPELLSKNAFIEAKKEAEIIHEKFVRGLEILIKEMTLWSKDRQDSLLGKFRKLVLGGKFQCCNLSKEEMSALGQIGKQLLAEGRFEEASCFLLVFSQLATPTEQVWLDFAMAEQKQGNFDVAIVMYSYANRLNPSSPIPYLHSAECYVEEEVIEEAQKLLDCALFFIETNKEWEHLLPLTRDLGAKLVHKNTLD